MLTKKKSFHEMRPQLRPFYGRNKNEIYPAINTNIEQRNIEEDRQKEPINLITENDNNFKTCYIDKEDSHQNKEGDILNDLRDIKENISKMKEEFKNANLAKLKEEISEMIQNNQRDEEIKNEIKVLKEEVQIIKNILLNYIDVNKRDANSDIENDNEIFEIVVQMDTKYHVFTIHPRITLNEIIYSCKKYFQLPNEINLMIHYFNKFGIKYFINNEEDFRESLDKKILFYYLNEDKNLSHNINPDISESYENEDEDGDGDEDGDEDYYESYIFNDEIEEQKNKEFYEKITHFASLAQDKIETKIEYFLNSADYISDFIQKYNPKKKEKYPKKFVDIDEEIKKPGLLIKENEDKNDIDFILSLIGGILKDKNIDLNILKYNEEEKSKDKLSDACLQYLFCGLLDKKKIEINFKLKPGKVKKLNKKKEELSEFIEEWKKKISDKLNIDIEDISLINPKKKGKDSFSLDLVSNNDSIIHNENKILSNFKEIDFIQEKSFIEACQLDNYLIEPKYNNQDGCWGINEKRGGEDYLPPEGWKGFGLDVKGKYDLGDNTWLDYKDREGVFAVAYLGLSNIVGDTEKYKKYLSEINIPEILKMNYQQTYKNDIDLRNRGKKCGCGIYLFQDPQIAENSAGIFDIFGIRYKVLLMCRVNPKKIRQPAGYKNCWILNPTPDEIRPYRILVKTIFNSPLANACQEELKIFTEPSLYYQDIIDKKDISFYKTNNTNFNNNNYVINLYTSNNYRYINKYLREGKITEGPFTEEMIKSWVWCLHDSLTKRKTNVLNTSILFRGLSLPFPEDLAVGSRFIFGEFFSTSKSLNIALTYSGVKTLFIVRIENNNVPPGFYCYDIEQFSEFPNEKEILITSNCVFEITKKEKKKIKQLKEELQRTDLDTTIDENKIILVVYLTCLGNFYDIQKETSFNEIENEDIE